MLLNGVESVHCKVENCKKSSDRRNNTVTALVSDIITGIVVRRYRYTLSHVQYKKQFLLLVRKLMAFSSGH